MPNSEPFLSTKRLLKGPWQAFERDVARLFVQNGFSDVVLVGRSGDGGADVIAKHPDGRLWVAQCKHTTGAAAKPSAVDEVIEAGAIYSADHLVVCVSRPASETLRRRILHESNRGLSIELAEPQTLLNWAANSPEFPSSSKRLRPYQEDAVATMHSALCSTGKGQVVLATGLGKTLVMAEVVARLFLDGSLPNGKVLVLAHTVPIVDQLIRSFWSQLPKWVHTHRLVGGEEPSYDEGITFATVQSVKPRLGEQPTYDLVLVDEAHHVGSETFQEVIRVLSPQMVGGATATPWRGDGFDIDSILGEPLVRIGISEGLQNQFLSEVDYRLLADNIDWEFVRSCSRNSYSVSQLNKRLIVPTRDQEAARLVASTFSEEHRRAGIVYCPSAIHAKEFAATLRQFGLTAEPILHDMDARTRAVLLSRFSRGKLQFVTTVDLFNEGVDVPDVDIIVFMRATHSRRIFVQQLGRGLRTSPTKDKVVVLDFVSDLRRIAEALALDSEAKGGVEHVGLGPRLIAFSDTSAGSFVREWMLDQASLLLREGDPTLTLPDFDFPRVMSPTT